MPQKTDSYFDKALSCTNRDLIDEMRRLTRGCKFDTIVGTGLSGTIFIARVAPGLGKKFAIVRKKDDQSTHSARRVEGEVGSRFIVADDFISSGNTLKHVLTVMSKKHPAASFVGVYQYEYGRFYDIDDCASHIGSWVADVALGGPVYGPKTYKEMLDHTWGSPVLRAPKGGWHPSVAPAAPLPPWDLLVLDYQVKGQPRFWDAESNCPISAADPRVRLMSEQVRISLIKDGSYSRYVGLRMDEVMRAVARYPEAAALRSWAAGERSRYVWRPPEETSAWLKEVPVQQLMAFNEKMRLADEAAIKFREAAREEKPC